MTYPASLIICNSLWIVASWSIRSILSDVEPDEAFKHGSWSSGCLPDIAAGVGKAILESIRQGEISDTWAIFGDPIPGMLLSSGSDPLSFPGFVVENTAVMRTSRRHGSIGEAFFGLDVLPLSTISVDSRVPTGEPSEFVTALPCFRYLHLLMSICFHSLGIHSRHRTPTRLCSLQES